jgi:hypothetical protein
MKQQPHTPRRAAAESIPRRFAPLVAGSLAVAVACLALGNFATDGREDGGVGPFLFITLLTVVATVLLWRTIVTPRVAGAAPAATVGVVLGVFSILFAPVYWLGLPWVVGPAAVALGIVGKERGEGGAATAAMNLGWVGLIAVAVVALQDTVG